jgi:hypothetical protein
MSGADLAQSFAVRQHEQVEKLREAEGKTVPMFRFWQVLRSVMKSPLFP